VENSQAGEAMQNPKKAEGIFEKGLLLLLWLLPFVRLEPAPADYMIWALGAYLLFKQPQAFWKQLPALLRWGVIFLLAGHVSLIWAPDLGRAAFFTLATLEMLVLLVLFASRNWQATSWRRLGLAYIGGSSLAATLGVLAYFGWLPYREVFMYGDIRAMALFKDPNVFGAHLVPALVLLWAVQMTDQKPSHWKRLVEGGIAFILTLGVLLAGSRAAWVGLALGLSLYIILLLIQDFDWSVLKRRWAIICGVLLALMMVLHPQVWSMLEQRAALIKPYDYDRFSAQGEALSSFASSKDSFGELVLHYVAGAGPGQSEVVLQYATHNLYLRVLYELGITGMLGLGLLLVSVGASLFRSLHKGDPWGTALVAILVSLLSISFLIDSLHWRHLFVFLGLAAGRSLDEQL
jgi:hypothetical protein